MGWATEHDIDRRFGGPEQYTDEAMRSGTTGLTKEEIRARQAARSYAREGQARQPHYQKFIRRGATDHPEGGNPEWAYEHDIDRRFGSPKQFGDIERRFGRPWPRD